MEISLSQYIVQDLILQGAIFSVPVNIGEKEIERYCLQWVSPYLKVVYTHPSIKFYIYISGRVLEYFESKGKEYKDVLLELIHRDQVELLGGMYYDAAPLIQAKKDQRGQLEKLHHFITKTYGTHVNGVWIHPGTFDSSIIHTLRQSGIRFLMVNRTYVEPEPVLENIGLLEQLGKTLIALPYFHSYKNTVVLHDNMYFYSQGRNNQSNAKISIFLCDSSILYDSPSFFDELELFQQKMEENNLTKHSALPRYFIKKSNVVSKDVCRIRIAPWGDGEIATFSKFVNSRPESRLLYGRLQYVMRLIEACKKHKNIDYASMNLSLWIEQNHFSLWKATTQWGIHHKTIRQNAYKALNAIEKIIKQTIKNKVTKVSNVDMNLDSVDEQFINTASFNVLIEPLWASVCLLERTSNLKRWNYSSCFVPYQKPQYAPWSFKDFLCEDTVSIDTWHKKVLNNEYTHVPVQYGFLSASESHASVSYESKKKVSQPHTSILEENDSTHMDIGIKKQYQVRGNTVTLHYDYNNNLSIPCSVQHIIEVNLSFFSDDKAFCTIIANGKTYVAGAFSHFTTEELVIQHTYKKEELHFYFSKKTDISIAPVHEMSQRLPETVSYQYTSLLFSVPLSMKLSEELDYSVQCTFSKM